MQWYKDDGNKVRCLLCTHHCSLHSGAVGICGVNKNIGGKLECLVYGHLAALHIDPIEKKPLYHMLPGSKTFSLGTVGCNFRCPFCQNWQISQTHDIDSKQFASPKQIVESACMQDCQSISFTYNEPTIFYPYVKDIAVLAKKRGLKTVFVTNGCMSDAVVNDMKGVIDAFNIDIKSFDNHYYRSYLKGSLPQVLKNAQTLKENGHWVEITTLIIPGHNDSNQSVKDIATFIAKNLGVQTPWHLSAFYPHYKELDTAITDLKQLEDAKKIAHDQGLKHVYIGNVGKKATTLCSSCGKKLIVRNGFEVEKTSLKGAQCKKCKTVLTGVFE